ncbi:hypothetical protein BJY00DRAFT_325676 [Aspergillus carlsbadensis]|nr:hypothetical protein BJY00DRAFT_325676 [Aspergillus carlsbadensis]
MHLQSLSPEILFNIADILASEHMPSLHTFSLTSRFCRDIANAHRFRGIHFHVRLANKLLGDIAHWEHILTQHNVFSSVRRLSFQTDPGIEGDGLLLRGDDYYQVKETDLYGRPFTSCFSPEDEWSEMHWPWGSINDRDEDHDAQDRAWEPMARFLRRLTGLRDLFWLQNGQFPRCLLEVLHAHLPRCRLHLRQFFFGALIRNPDDIACYEYALATSPVLGSFACTFVLNAIVNAHAQRVQNAHAQHISMQMVAGSAPNLERAFLGRRPSSTRSGQLAWDWDRDALAAAGHGVRESMVRSLALCTPSVEDVAGLARHVRFDALTSLAVSSRACSDTLALFARYRFSALTCLALRLDPSAPSEDAKETLDRDSTRLLASLPPLRSLLITGHSIKSPVSDALQYHGASLRKLGILYTGSQQLAAETIAEIGTKCPRLRELTLRIPRTIGNTDEVAYYRALGKIPHLNSLTLELDCAARINGERPTDRQALINVAVDEALVRSILALVAPSPFSLLERLDLSISRIDMQSRVQYLEILSRETTWQVFRDARGEGKREGEGDTGSDGNGDGVFVHRHLKDRRRPARDAYPEVLAAYRHVLCEREFRELWPVQEGGESGFWWDDICSFPLEVGVDGEGE